VNNALAFKQQKAQRLMFCGGQSLFNSQVIAMKITFSFGLVDIQGREAWTQRSHS
jgi:hypothetical protein